MIRVRFKPPSDDPKWNAWNEKAERETATLIAASPRKIKEALYKEAQNWIVSIFHGKCAYCEVRLDVSQHKGDLDHFRPKKRVTDQNGAIVRIRGTAHPGYYWLAYRWWNLLPSCISCNRPARGPDGVRRGKWDQFPIAGSYAMASSDDLKREKPLLLHPYDDRPDEHLEFDIKTGMVFPKTSRGQRTIETLGLNRDGLIEARLQTIEYVSAIWSDMMDAVSKRDTAAADRKQQEIALYESGVRPFAAAARAILHVVERDAGARLEARRATG
jgi:uncharacterized protein (TIGR02646 family)